jgi:hypothetical protein
MRILNAVVVLFLSLVLIACGGSGDSLSSVKPTIGTIYTDILHSHPSFYTKWGITPVRNIRFTVSVAVTDPQGIDNLADVIIRQIQDNWYWSLLGGVGNTELEDCYITSIEIFECVFYDRNRLDSILLKEWELLVEDKDGNTSSKRFEFLLPGGGLPDDERFVYSSEFTGSFTNGVAALEAMTVAGNDIVFTANPGTESFHIEFTPSDIRARRYEFAFYESSSGRDYIGSAQVDSPSISGISITPGLDVVIDVPWSEIEFNEGFDANDVGGLHVKLFDESIDWATPKASGSWFNYVSFSEYISL